MTINRFGYQKSHNNGSEGLVGNRGSIIDNNKSHNNTGDGIIGSKGRNIVNNISYQYGDDGISITSFDGGRVCNKRVHSNTGFGVRFAAAINPCSQNNIINNTAGTVNQGFNMGDNFGETNKTCPQGGGMLTR